MDIQKDGEASPCWDQFSKGGFITHKAMVHTGPHGADRTHTGNICGMGACGGGEETRSNNEGHFQDP